jgi:uroporphyrinogen decarboxylase
MQLIKRIKNKRQTSKGGLFMNAKEIMLKALKLEKTPRLPVALLSGGVWTMNRRGYSLQDILTNPELAAEIIINASEEIRSDIVWPGSGYHNLAIRALGGQIKFRAKGAPDVQAPLIDKAGDVDQLKLERLKEDSGIQSIWRTIEIVSRTLGSQYLIGGSQWGPFTLAGHIYGVERLMRSIYKDQEAVFKVLDFTAELCYQYLASFIDAGVEIVSIADPSASGDLISRGQFEEFVLPHLKQVVTKLHQKGAFVCIHICGNITNRLDLIPETGVDLLSMDYKVDLHKAKEVLGGKIAFSGNMNPVGIMQNATPAEVIEACRSSITKTSAIPGYILMPGCDIPPGVPLENIQVMVKTACEHIYY